MFRQRPYWPAILVAALASFLFEAAWFTLFLKQWLAGTGHTMAWLVHSMPYPPAVQYATALACSIIVGIALSILIQMTGPQTARRGALMGALIWAGILAPAYAKDYIFAVRTLEFYAINVGYTLFDLMLIGAIVGGWKSRKRLL